VTGCAVVFRARRDVALVEFELRPPGPGEVLVRTLYSGISAGTELTQFRGTNPHASKAWDAERRLFVDGASRRDEYPLDGFAYEQVGEVVETGAGVTGFAPGDVVWGVWGHRSSAVLPDEHVAPRRLRDVPPLVGVFPRIGAVALNAVLDADLHVGEVVAVFGQGVAGLIATQLAALNGATVIAVDLIPRRLELARSFGAAHVLDARGQQVAEAIKELTGGRGADASIELSGAYAALHEAIRATAYASRVVLAGFAQGEATPLSLGEEFHHNRIELVSSQISNVAPRLAHRWSPLRLERTIADLCAQGRLQLEPLVTHVLPVGEAADAYRLLDERPHEAVQVVLDFS
jgi:threonine dehydrogenase-like Zn-dependent dehydrogenase